MNQKDMINKYPALFTRYYLPMTQTEMCWGLQIGRGWLPIIDELCFKIQKLIDDKQIEKFEFECIKEKYSSLRIYGYPVNKEIQKLIEQAKNLAANTCESCTKHIEYSSSDSEDDDKIEEVNNNYDRLCNDCK